jgi:hypothetical protein
MSINLSSRDATDILSDIRKVVRYNGMHKHSVPFYNVYVLQFGFLRKKVKFIKN